MSNFDLHEFNILSKKHNYFLTNNRIHGFPVLQDSSIFLQKILAHRTSNSSGKKINIKTINQNETGPFKEKLRIYQSPNITQSRLNGLNNFNIESIKPINSRKINQNINIISPERTINDNNILMNRIITPTYYKIPITINNRISKSPDLSGTVNINNKLGDEIRVLNFGGKKIFATNSFNGLTNYTQSNNTPIKTESSELFRNYDELKKKKEEIFRRKMKRNSSLYRKELLKKQKDKEIKQQTININFIDNNNKLRIIPLKKKLIMNSKSQSRLFQNEAKKEKEVDSNKKPHNIIVLQKSKNLYNKKKFKTNNIFISKNIKNNLKPKNNNNQINQKIKENLEYLRLKKEKSKPTINSPETIKQKKFVEDYNPNLSQIIYSNDRKISIKMNVLKDKNVTFAKKDENINKIFEIQKVICINYKCGKENCINNGLIKNKKIKRKKNLDGNILSSIKEEDNSTEGKTLTKPFTFLILGVDSISDVNAAFNGDTIMIVTFNPKTLNATMFSIPRDTYAKVACGNRQFQKINTSAYGGAKCVKKTVESITGLNIDYYIKINFKYFLFFIYEFGNRSLYCSGNSNRIH
ncbi:LCP family protein [uncultured Methanobrevibacter sp.]|uniref:LCP family protein n=1 Tax=uncultured Methanobrevibacter sp. TaxID=253161 RepID=UPI002603E56C